MKKLLLIFSTAITLCACHNTSSSVKHNTQRVHNSMTYNQSYYYPNPNGNSVKKKTHKKNNSKTEQGSTNPGYASQTFSYLKNFVDKTTLQAGAMFALAGKTGWDMYHLFNIIASNEPQNEYTVSTINQSTAMAWLGSGALAGSVYIQNKPIVRNSDILLMLYSIGAISANVFFMISSLPTFNGAEEFKGEYAKLGFSGLLSTALAMDLFIEEFFRVTTGSRIIKYNVQRVKKFFKQFVKNL